MKKCTPVQDLSSQWPKPKIWERFACSRTFFISFLHSYPFLSQLANTITAFLFFIWLLSHINHDYYFLKLRYNFTKQQFCHFLHHSKPIPLLLNSHTISDLFRLPSSFRWYLFSLLSSPFWFYIPSFNPEPVIKMANFISWLWLTTLLYWFPFLLVFYSSICSNFSPNLILYPYSRIFCLSCGNFIFAFTSSLSFLLSHT